MSRRTYSFNAFTSQLASPITAGSTSITLGSTTGLQAPCYLVIAPDSTTKREYVKVLNLSAPTLENVTRGLPGSVAGAQAHDSGVEVRAVMVHQIIDDIFQDIIDLESGASGHYGGIDLADHPEATGTSRGFMSAADYLKLSLIDDLAERNQTDQEILNQLLNVDGPGSSLNADLLDGQHASAFALVDDSAASIVAAQTSGSGSLQVGPMFDIPSAFTQLTIPTEWNLCKVVAMGSLIAKAGSGGSAQVGARIVIGTDNGPTMDPGVIYTNTSLAVPVSNLAAGISGTSVTVKIQGQGVSGTPTYEGASLIAVAHRTS